MKRLGAMIGRTGAAMACALLASCQSSSSRLDDPIAHAPVILAGDYARLQGTWVVVYNETKGVPLREMAGALFIFERDRFRLGDDHDRERFAIDEASSPKRIDFDDDTPQMHRAIYRLEGDTLAICGSGPGEPRPTAFRTSIFSSDVLTLFERKK